MSLSFTSGKKTKMESKIKTYFKLYSGNYSDGPMKLVIVK